MKKRVLSLILAGAMMAPMVSTSYANTVTGNDTNPLTGDVTLEGNIMSNQGTAPAGKIHVELPTSMEFTVDQAGNFTTATNYSITNKGQGDVSVKVSGFTETRPSDGIKVQETKPTDQDGREVVQLTLSGDAGKNVILKHGMAEAELFDTIGSNTTATMTLAGEVGSKPYDQSAPSEVDKNGVSEQFNIQFKIAKK